MSILTNLFKFNPVTIMPTIYKWLAISGVILAMCVAAFFYGKHLGDERSKQVIAEYNAKKLALDNDLQEIEVKSNQHVVDQFQNAITVTKTVVKTNEKTIYVYVHDTELLSIGWVLSHDASAAGNTIDTTAAANGTPSTFTAVDALATVNNNYGTCKETAEQLISLQDWITQHNADIAKVNADARKK